MNEQIKNFVKENWKELLIAGGATVAVGAVVWNLPYVKDKRVRLMFDLAHKAEMWCVKHYGSMGYISCDVNEVVLNKFAKTPIPEEVLAKLPCEMYDAASKVFEDCLKAYGVRFKVY